MVHETLAYDSFARSASRPRGLATPTARSTAIDYGVYLDVETLDDVLLPAGSPRPSTSTRGTRRDDVTPADAGSFEVDEGDEEDRADLEALIAAAAATGTGPKACEAVADLAR